jgi:hypothetical protein
MKQLFYKYDVIFKVIFKVSYSPTWSTATAEERPSSRWRPGDLLVDSDSRPGAPSTAAVVSSSLLYPDHAHGMVLLADLKAAVAIVPTRSVMVCSSSPSLYASFRPINFAVSFHIR